MAKRCLWILSWSIACGSVLAGTADVNSACARDFLANVSAAEVASVPLQRNRHRVETFDEVWRDSSRDRSVPVRLYVPVGAVEPCPIILFSHGLGGSTKAAPYLGEEWASRGYFCVFMQHPGSDRSLWQGAQSKDAVVASLKTGANGMQGVERVKDVRFVIDALEQAARKPVHGCRLDVEKIGMSGHSFGARTALRVAGEQAGFRRGGRMFSMKDSRVDAAIYLSPGKYKGGIPAQQAFAGIRIPGIVVTGSEDRDPIQNSGPDDRAANFDHLSAPDQYLLFYNGAAHSTFGGRRTKEQPSSVDARVQESLKVITSCFWDAYLRGDEQAKAWLKDRGLDKFMAGDGIVRKK